MCVYIVACKEVSVVEKFKASDWSLAGSDAPIRLLPTYTDFHFSLESDL